MLGIGVVRGRGHELGLGLLRALLVGTVLLVGAVLLVGTVGRAIGFFLFVRFVFAHEVFVAGSFAMSV